MQLFVTGQSQHAIASLAARLNLHDNIYVATGVDLAGAAGAIDRLFDTHALALERAAMERRDQLSFRDWLDPLGVLPSEAFPPQTRKPTTGRMRDDATVHRLASLCPPAPLPIRQLGAEDAMLGLFIALSGWKTLKCFGSAETRKLTDSGFIEKLLARFPNLRVIHLLADPVDAVAARVQEISAQRGTAVEAGDILVAIGEYLADSSAALALKKRMGDSVLLVSAAALRDPTRRQGTDEELANFLQVFPLDNATAFDWPRTRPEPGYSTVRSAMRAALEPFEETCAGTPEAFIEQLARLAMPNRTGVSLPLTEHGGVLVSSRGLATPEASGCWTMSPSIELRWRVEGAPCSRVSLTVRPRRPHSGEPIRAVFSLGGAASIDRTLEQNENWSTVHTIEVSAEAPVPVGEVVRLRIEIANPKRMNEPPVEDPRALGVFLLSATPLEAA